MSYFAPSLEERNLNLKRYGINSMMIFLKEPGEHKAQNIMRGFLTASANKYSTFNAFLSYSKSVDFLNHFYKKRIKIKAMHSYVLEKTWDKSYINITQNNVLGKSKSKKVTKLMKKIYAISNETKERVLKCYFDH